MCVHQSLKNERMNEWIITFLYFITHEWQILVKSRAADFPRRRNPRPIDMLFSHRRWLWGELLRQTVIFVFKFIHHQLNLLHNLETILIASHFKKHSQKCYLPNVHLQNHICSTNRWARGGKYRFRELRRSFNSIIMYVI